MIVKDRFSSTSPWLIVTLILMLVTTILLTAKSVEAV